jgi:hypothetical protein
VLGSVLAVVVSAGLGRTALAQSPPSLVEWEAPQACPGAASVYERLTVALGYEPQTLGKLSRVRGVVVPHGAGYQLSLEVFEGGRRSSRWMEAASCEDLVDAAVLAITLALAPEGSAASANHPAGEMEETSPAQEAVVRPVAPEPAAEPTRGTASLAAVVELGALPDPALGVGMSAGARWPVLSVAAYGMLFESQRLAARPRVYVDFELSVAGLRACGRALSQPLTLDACAGMEVGRWEAFGASLQEARRSRDLWLAPMLELEASRVLIGPLAVELSAGAALPLARKRYIINESEAVYTPEPISWRFLAGLAVATQ